MEADNIIELVQGASAALTTQLEESLPNLPWTDDLRAAVREQLEAGIGPEVARITEALIGALR